MWCGPDPPRGPGLRLQVRLSAGAIVAKVYGEGEESLEPNGAGTLFSRSLRIALTHEPHGQRTREMNEAALVTRHPIGRSPGDLTSANGTERTSLPR
jgi:hypothetical protein